jgi:hypothetical protein
MDRCVGLGPVGVAGVTLGEIAKGLAVSSEIATELGARIAGFL